MQIKLLLGDEEKTFTAGRPKGRAVREAIALANKMDPKKINGEVFDELIDFTVDVYGKQFTRDDVYDGLYADEILQEMTKTVSTIAGGTSKKLETKNE
jgi:hypothetical protein